jgi:pheromone shutdown protein TraB
MRLRTTAHVEADAVGRVREIAHADEFRAVVVALAAEGVEQIINEDIDIALSV